MTTSRRIRDMAFSIGSTPVRSIRKRKSQLRQKEQRRQAQEVANTAEEAARAEREAADQRLAELAAATLAHGQAIESFDEHQRRVRQDQDERDAKQAAKQAALDEQQAGLDRLRPAATAARPAGFRGTRRGLPRRGSRPRRSAGLGRHQRTRPSDGRTILRQRSRCREGYRRIRGAW